MGKVDVMRAMREAKYAATQKQAPEVRASKAKAALEQATGPASAPAELCGHRSISKKSCTREADHLATGTKNHRYS